MSRTLGRGLIGISLAEEEYKVDLEVTDRYQSFSTELLRLSLLGIAGYGFLLSEVVFKNEQSTAFFTRLSKQQISLGIGLFAFGLATAAALAHRYFSTDCITHQISILRLLKRQKQSSLSEEEQSHLQSSMSGEKRALRTDLKRCQSLLVVAACALLAGAIAVSATFAATLFSEIALASTQ